MKNFLCTLLLFTCLSAFGQTPEGEMVLVELSCGQCQFGMDGSGCDLALKLDGEKYYVDGVKMDDYGDAHGHDGMCNTIRTAKVSGEVVEGRFVVSNLVLLPMEE